MNPLWDYFWPIFAAGVVIGAVAGRLAFRKVRAGRRNRLAAGAAVALVAALLWHGPLGAGERLAATVERIARAELRYQEMAGVRAALERRPLLGRRLVLTGPADDFQQAELVRMLDEIPGVGGVRWASAPRPSDGVK